MAKGFCEGQEKEKELAIVLAIVSLTREMANHHREEEKQGRAKRRRRRKGGTNQAEHVDKPAGEGMGKFSKIDILCFGQNKDKASEGVPAGGGATLANMN